MRLRTQPAALQVHQQIRALAGGVGSSDGVIDAGENGFTAMSVSCRSPRAASCSAVVTRLDQDPHGQPPLTRHAHPSCSATTVRENVTVAAVITLVATVCSRLDAASTPVGQIHCAQATSSPGHTGISSRVRTTAAGEAQRFQSGAAPRCTLKAGLPGTR